MLLSAAPASFKLFEGKFFSPFAIKVESQVEGVIIDVQRGAKGATPANITQLKGG